MVFEVPFDVSHSMMILHCSSLIHESGHFLIEHIVLHLVESSYHLYSFLSRAVFCESIPYLNVLNRTSGLDTKWQSLENLKMKSRKRKLSTVGF